MLFKSGLLDSGMKSKIVNSESETEGGLVFPLLAKSERAGIIVLFKGLTSGVVLVGSPYHNYEVGYESDSFKSCIDKEHWEILKGKTTIEFEV